MRAKLLREFEKASTRGDWVEIERLAKAIIKIAQKQRKLLRALGRLNPVKLNPRHEFATVRRLRPKQGAAFGHLLVVEFV